MEDTKEKNGSDPIEDVASTTTVKMRPKRKSLVETELETSLTANSTSPITPEGAITSGYRKDTGEKNGSDPKKDVASTTAVKITPKRKSLVERELETSLTAKAISPITPEGAITSRYGRARRLKSNMDFCDTEKAVSIALKSTRQFLPVKSKPIAHEVSISPTAPNIKPIVDTIHAGGSQIQKDLLKLIPVTSPNLENRIETIYNTNISLSRFGAEEHQDLSLSGSKPPKTYSRKDLIQTKTKDETVTLIKNMFSPPKSNRKNSHLKNILERSEKFDLSQMKSLKVTFSKKLSPCPALPNSEISTKTSQKSPMKTIKNANLSINVSTKSPNSQITIKTSPNSSQKIILNPLKTKSPKRFPTQPRNKSTNNASKSKKSQNLNYILQRLCETRDLKVNKLRARSTGSPGAKINTPTLKNIVVNSVQKNTPQKSRSKSGNITWVCSTEKPDPIAATPKPQPTYLDLSSEQNDSSGSKKVNTSYLDNSSVVKILDFSDNKKKTLDIDSNKKETLDLDSNDKKSLNRNSNKKNSLDMDDNKRKSLDSGNKKKKISDIDSNEKKSLDSLNKKRKTSHRHKNKTLDSDDNNKLTPDLHSNKRKIVNLEDRKNSKNELPKINLTTKEMFKLEENCAYQIGDLAWARMGMYPFWPCIIAPEPVTKLFVKKKLFGRIVRDMIHVTFFGDNGRRSWIVHTMLREYRGRAEFEAYRDWFTPEDKKKDPKFCAAFFVSEKKQGLWNMSVDEAEILYKHPKEQRIDMLYDLLSNVRVSKNTPKNQSTSCGTRQTGKITRTDSDVSLSESLYDTLFSDDDGPKDDSERSRNKTRNKTLDVSEVVTACLDNMAAKTGITKIQRQSHMDIWLQKAKTKTPEKVNVSITVERLNSGEDSDKDAETEKKTDKNQPSEAYLIETENSKSKEADKVTRSENVQPKEAEMVAKETKNSLKKKKIHLTPTAVVNVPYSFRRRNLQPLGYPANEHDYSIKSNDMGTSATEMTVIEYPKESVDEKTETLTSNYSGNDNMDISVDIPDTTETRADNKTSDTDTPPSIDQLLVESTGNTEEKKSTLHYDTGIPIADTHISNHDKEVENDNRNSKMDISVDIPIKTQTDNQTSDTDTPPSIDKQSLLESTSNTKEKNAASHYDNGIPIADTYISISDQELESDNRNSKMDISVDIPITIKTRADNHTSDTDTPLSIDKQLVVETKGDTEEKNVTSHYGDATPTVDALISIHDQEVKNGSRNNDMGISIDIPTTTEVLEDKQTSDTDTALSIDKQLQVETTGNTEEKNGTLQDNIRVAIVDTHISSQNQEIVDALMNAEEEKTTVPVGTTTHVIDVPVSSDEQSLVETKFDGNEEKETMGNATSQDDNRIPIDTHISSHDQEVVDTLINTEEEKTTLREESATPTIDAPISNDEQTLVETKIDGDREKETVQNNSKIPTTDTHFYIDEDSSIEILRDTEEKEITNVNKDLGIVDKLVSDETKDAKSEKDEEMPLEREKAEINNTEKELDKRLVSSDNSGVMLNLIDEHMSLEDQKTSSNGEGTEFGDTLVSANVNVVESEKDEVASRASKAATEDTYTEFEEPMSPTFTQDIDEDSIDYSFNMPVTGDVRKRQEPDIQPEIDINDPPKHSVALTKEKINAPSKVCKDFEVPILPKIAQNEDFVNLIDSRSSSPTFTQPFDDTVRTSSPLFSQTEYVNETGTGNDSPTFTQVENFDFDKTDVIKSTTALNSNAKELSDQQTFKMQNGYAPSPRSLGSLEEEYAHLAEQDKQLIDEHPNHDKIPSALDNNLHNSHFNKRKDQTTELNTDIKTITYLDESSTDCESLNVSKELKTAEPMDCDDICKQIDDICGVDEETDDVQYVTLSKKTQIITIDDVLGDNENSSVAMPKETVKITVEECVKPLNIEDQSLNTTENVPAKEMEGITPAMTNGYATNPEIAVFYDKKDGQTMPDKVAVVLRNPVLEEISTDKKFNSNFINRDAGKVVFIDSEKLLEQLKDNITRDQNIGQIKSSKSMKCDKVAAQNKVLKILCERIQETDTTAPTNEVRPAKENININESDNDSMCSELDNIALSELKLRTKCELLAKDSATPDDLNDSSYVPSSEDFSEMSELEINDTSSKTKRGRRNNEPKFSKTVLSKKKCDTTIVLSDTDSIMDVPISTRRLRKKKSTEYTKVNGVCESKDSSPDCSIEEDNLDIISIKSDDSETVISKRKGKPKKDSNNSKQDPEFLKYLEFRQDALMDEHPELTEEEIVLYLHKTWLYEENLKSDTKKTDDVEQSVLVKGMANDTAPKKGSKKKNIKRTIDINKVMSNGLKGQVLEPRVKPRRKAAITSYVDDFSDIEEEIEMFEIFKDEPTVKSNNVTENKVSRKDDDIKTESSSSLKSEPEITERDNKDKLKKYETELEKAAIVNTETGQSETIYINEEEEYFKQLTKPKPNVFKGLVREKVCEICERTSELVKCKGCNGMFHVKCTTAKVKVEVTPVATRGRKKKKCRGRKTGADSNLDDSQSDEKVQDASVSDALNLSADENTAIVVFLDKFEERAAVYMKELIEANTAYDSYSSDDGLDWEDCEVGKCEIVDVKLKPRRPPVDTMNFKCENCLKYDTPLCFVCKSDVSPKSQAVTRQRCQVAHCHKYYHVECLDLWPQTQFNSGEPSRRDKKISENFEALTCPRHVCHTCVCDDPRGCKTRFSGDKLARCVRCPATYHTFTKCLPAGTQILTASHIICPRHHEIRPGKVPCHVNTGWCFICALGGSLICCEYCPTSFHAECLQIKPPEGGYMCEDCETGRLPLYGEMVWVKLGHYRWWPGIILHPSEIPDNILAVKHSPGEFVVRFFGQYDHYWVNRGRVFPFQEGDSGRISSQKSKIDEAFTTAMEHAHRAFAILKNAAPNEEESLDIASSLLPPHYVKLKVNKPCGSLCGKKIDIEESSLTQCGCDPNEEEPCGPDSQCLNRMLLTECGPNCRAGDRCKNRDFEKRNYPKMVPYRTPHRGWGLKTLEPIRAGQFVIEYVGELIDEEEFRRRMNRQHEMRDENYYFLTLDKERMIDAGPKGNLARFMNHCCEPNCETQKWTVLGDVRVGLFAINDIPANTEVNFNYNLECAGIEKKRCLCGAKRCSGYIGAKPKQEESQPKKSKPVVQKRPYKKRNKTQNPNPEEPSTSTVKVKGKRGRPRKIRELTEIEKDLLIIKNATNGLSSDSETSLQTSETKDSNPLKRKRVSFSTEDMMVYDGSSSPSVKRMRVEGSSEVGD